VPPIEWTWKTEECCALNIQRLHKQGCFRASYWTSLSWKSTSGRITTVGLSTDPPYGIRLEYTVTDADGKPCSIDDRVSLTWSPCHLGGERPWFLCPRCSRRVGVLYLLHNFRFRCRHCHRLRYRCKSETPWSRAQRKTLKIERRLGDVPWIKPKWMHQTTFDRLHKRLREAKEAENECFVVACLPLLMRTGYMPR
jgi:hypothetical protein